MLQEISPLIPPCIDEELDELIDVVRNEKRRHLQDEGIADFLSEAQHDHLRLGFLYSLFKADKTIAVFVLHFSFLFFFALTRVTLRRESNLTSTMMVGYFETFRTPRANDSHHGKYVGQHIILDEASQIKEHERLLSPICSGKTHQSPSTATGVQRLSKSEEKLPQQDHTDLKDVLIMTYNETINLSDVEMSTEQASRFGNAGQTSIEHMIENAMSDRLSSKKVIRQLEFRRGRPQVQYQKSLWIRRIQSFRSESLPSAEDVQRFLTTILDKVKPNPITVCLAFHGFSSVSTASRRVHFNPEDFVGGVR